MRKQSKTVERSAANFCGSILDIDLFCRIGVVRPVHNPRHSLYHFYWTWTRACQTASAFRTNICSAFHFSMVSPSSPFNGTSGAMWLFWQTSMQVGPFLFMHFQPQSFTASIHSITLLPPNRHFCITDTHHQNTFVQILIKLIVDFKAVVLDIL